MFHKYSKDGKTSEEEKNKNYPEHQPKKKHGNTPDNQKLISEDPHHHTTDDKQDFHPEVCKTKTGRESGRGSHGGAKGVPGESRRTPGRGSRRVLAESQKVLKECQGVLEAPGGVVVEGGERRVGVRGSPTQQKKIRRPPNPPTSGNVCRCGHLWVASVEKCFSLWSWQTTKETQMSHLLMSNSVFFVQRLARSCKNKICEALTSRWTMGEHWSLWVGWRSSGAVRQIVPPNFDKKTDRRAYVREGDDVLAPHGTARDAKVVRGYVANSGRKIGTAVDRRRVDRFVTGSVSVDQSGVK